mmetsp:Transcript_6731/g.11756  ORF Transcript_6731/g.11756 Transcript_6731/m.11756 type:complete len:108 (+) Transcript_6731:475-798(+)
MWTIQWGYTMRGCFARHPPAPTQWQILFSTETFMDTAVSLTNHALKESITTIISTMTQESLLAALILGGTTIELLVGCKVEGIPALIPLVQNEDDKDNFDSNNMFWD